MTDPVLVEVVDRVATITLHQPEVRNAINGPMRRGIAEVVNTLETDDTVSVLVLTGTDPAFCAGLDLKELGSRPDPLVGDELSTGGVVDRQCCRQAVLSTGSVSPFPGRTKPLVGAINGAAVTGGFELALNCDFLIAVFADTHARSGSCRNGV